ncbi:Bromodomain containing protein [Quillaja saponaria]|uniref:Bromodomain containing protein n=1 Tax=Quillaja saponaria TaxID=32244 RepID=A0AAD7PMA9_QUISA|nr:Bromodomain containing protein [Quillaja saponaria]KAJ7961032.1 Bromodomain containing protein [Quillaja saponaria]
MRKEGQRRSPRISALEAWPRPLVVPTRSQSQKVTTSLQLGNGGKGPAFRIRGKKKRKLRPAEELPSPSSGPNQGGKQSDHEDVQIKSDKQPSSSSTTRIPDKCILELILDLLQRRDAYEIFAEPVDPNEVEDYYEIIEEPMDFGTMRAKLHEGMYKSLDQFEHDVFLIFKNAMHFNSSATIYFRQARSLHELAIKIFHFLKTNPENFESEFSETRRRCGRRTQGAFRSTTNVKSSGSTSAFSKIMPSSFCSTSNRKAFKVNNRSSDIAMHLDAKDHENISGVRDGRRYRSFEVDKRCTYRRLKSLDENDSIFSTVYSKFKILEHVKQHDISYRESLMVFVKDLGPTANSIAERKLLGCQIHMACTSSQWKPGTLHPVTAQTSQNFLSHFSADPRAMKCSNDRVDLGNASGGVKAYNNGKIHNCVMEGNMNSDRSNGNGPLREEIQASDGMMIQSLFHSNMYPNQSSPWNSSSSRTEVGDLSCSVDGFKDAHNESIMMLLQKPKLINQAEHSELGTEHSQSNMLELRLKRRCKSPSSSRPLQTLDELNIEFQSR